jgi:hypothetical protein
MKKLLLLAITGTIGISAFAQHTAITSESNARIVNDQHYLPISAPNTAAKTTGLGDTLGLTHFGSGDTTTIYSFVHDTGFVLGTNVFGDKGFAERYDFASTDSTLKVIGVVALFGGTITPASTKTVTLNVWSQAAKTVSYRPTIFDNGLPGSVLTSRIVPITQLGIGLADTAADTTKAFVFASPTAFLTDSFFVGYTINYTWAALAGDTIGLYSNQDNERNDPVFFPYSTSDTTINNVNVTQSADGAWHDNAVDGYGLLNNLSIFPIVIVGPGTVGVPAVTRKDFTFYGNYPNPATNNTNVKFALAATADVTLSVMDMSGRMISTISEKNLTAGAHEISVNTSALPAGEYIYAIQTNNGGGIASKMVVTR